MIVFIRFPPIPVTTTPCPIDHRAHHLQALEKHCLTDNGYQGVVNVDSTNPSGDDVQQVVYRIMIAARIVK